MGARGRRFESYHSDPPNLFSGMEIIELTEAEAEERLEEMVDSCETGQVYCIVRPDGTKIMMVPADPSLIPDDYADLYNSHDDAC